MMNQSMAISMAVLAAGVLLTIPVLAAGAPSVTITSIKAGQTISASQIPVIVDVSNFTVECADVGMPGKAGQGHIHAMIDGMNMAHLTNFYCSDSFNISGVGLSPGEHVLAVGLADDAHTDLGKPATVRFDYRPTAVKVLPGAMSGGKPTVTILEPKGGATIGKRFDLVVAVKHFDLSCDLEGKPDVAGWGHLHVFASQAEAMQKMAEKKMGGMKGEMMSMVGMIGMPCTTTVPVDLSSWHSGKTHLTVMLAKNDHEPVAATTPAAVEVTLK